MVPPEDSPPRTPAESGGRFEEFFVCYARVQSVLRLASAATRTGGDHRTRRYRCAFESSDPPGPWLARLSEETRRSGPLKKIFEAVLWEQSREWGDTETVQVEPDPVGGLHVLLQSLDALITGTDAEWPGTTIAPRAGFPYRALVGTDPRIGITAYQRDRETVVEGIKKGECLGWRRADRDGPILNYLLFRRGARLELLGTAATYDSYY